METLKLKESLLQIAEKVEEDTTVEDIFKQLSYLNTLKKKVENIILHITRS